MANFTFNPSNSLDGKIISSPSVEVTHLSKDSIKFTISNSEISMANALRRIMISEVPTLAIDLVTIYENTSVLHDEYLCHRLGLIPIDSQLVNEFNYRDECDCVDQCPKCSIDYLLDISCTSDDTLNVTHLDIFPDGGSEDTPMPIRLLDSDGEDQHIMIVKLRKKQSIKAKLTAYKGIGKIHAKWIPVSTAVYKLDRKIVLNKQVENSLNKDEKLSILEVLPTDVLKYEDVLFGIGKGRLVTGESAKENLLDVYENKLKDHGIRNLLRVEEDETKFYFTVESTGALPADKIAEFAFDILEEKAILISSELKELHTSMQERGSQIRSSRVLYNLD